MKTPLIRPYSEDDRFFVLDLLEVNTPHFFSASEKQDFENYLDNEREQYFVVEMDGRIVGCGGINFANDPTTGKISWDIIHPDYQGNGIGKLSLLYRIEILKKFPRLERIIVRTSQHAYHFYEKNGFELLEMHPDYWAKGFDMYLMKFVG